MLRFTTRCVFLDFDQFCSLYVPRVRELMMFSDPHRVGLDTLPTKRARSSRKSKSKKCEIPLESGEGSRKAVPYLSCHIDLSFFFGLRPSPSSFAFHSITPLFDLAKKASRSSKTFSSFCRKAEFYRSDASERECTAVLSFPLLLLLPFQLLRNKTAFSTAPEPKFR